MTLLRLLILRSLRSRPLRTLLSGFGIVLGVATILAISITNQTALESVTRLFKDTSGKANLVVSSADAEAGGFSENVLQRLRAVPGLAAAVPTVHVQTILAEEAGQAEIGLNFFGASAGGPILKDRIWLWASYGVQDLFSYTIYNYPDRTLFNNYNLKLDARPIAGNQFEALFTTSSKEKFGANSSTSKPEGDHQTGRYHLGNPIFKLQDEQRVGNDFLVSLKFTTNKTGAVTRPMIDEDVSDPVTYDIGNGRYVPFTSAYGRSWDWSSDRRTKKDLQLTATLYKDSLLGKLSRYRVIYNETNRN